MTPSDRLSRLTAFVRDYRRARELSDPFGRPMTAADVTEYVELMTRLDREAAALSELEPTEEPDR